MGKVSDAEARAIAERAAGLSRPRVARAGREVDISGQPAKKIPVNVGERGPGSSQPNLIKARRGGLEPVEKPLDLARAFWREWSEKVPAEQKPSFQEPVPAAPPKTPGGLKPPMAPNYAKRVGVPKVEPKPKIPEPVVKPLTMAQKYPGVFVQKGALDLTQAERDAIIDAHEKARAAEVDHSSEATNVKSATSKARSSRKGGANYWWEPPAGAGFGGGESGIGLGTGDAFREQMR
jgi:hypothetical protein